MPTSRQSGRGRRTTKGNGDDPSPSWEPVFSGDENLIRGEVLVTLTPTAADSMTESVPLHPVGPVGSSVRALGVDDLDSVLADLGAYDIARLAPSSTGMAATASTSADFGLLPNGSAELSRSFRIRIDSEADVVEAASRIEAVSTVEQAEPNRWREATFVPNDPQFANQWGLSKINAPAAWDTTTGSSSVVVAVIDSGCDLDHSELASLLVPGFDMVDLGPAPIPQPGWRFEGDFAGRDPTPEDEVGHGTHVAGTIACLTNNAAGVAGVSWQTKIMPIKALTRMVRIVDGRVTGVGSSADIAAAIRHAADNGAHVINMSLGSDAPTSVESSAVAYAIGKGLVVIAAMGNNGTANPSYPAAYPGVVAVGAVDRADRRARFSQTGPHIDVSAPGVGILSTYLASGTATMDGTSMATPHVSGVAALIKAVKPSAAGTEIADILRSTARALRDAPGDQVPNDQYGHGCVDAKAAVDKAVGAVVGAPPTAFTRLRTPILQCVPRTWFVRDCQPRTVFGCAPHTLIGSQCPPVTRWCPVTQPPTAPPTPVLAGGTATAQPGYDPYGLMGGATTDQPSGDQPAAPERGSYDAGYADGYAAALAEVQQAVAQEAQGGFGLQPGWQIPRSALVWCPPWTHHPQLCPPLTVGTEFCPVPTPPWNRTWPTPPPPWLGATGQQVGGYDPYGPSPFQG